MRNETKNKLREGKAAVGTSATVDNLAVTDAVGRAGFDFILIDTQHLPIGTEALERMTSGLLASGSEVIVRVLANDPALINRALDYGADGVIIPYVNTAEEAAHTLVGAKYPPAGARSWSPRNTARYGGIMEYTVRANDETLVLPQIETAQAVDNIDEILEVEGIDGIMVGPADLGLTMGYPPRMSGNPEVEEKIQHVLNRCQEHGVPFGIFAGALENAEMWVSRGAQIATVGGDVGFMVEGAAKTLKGIEEMLSRTGASR